MTNKILEKSNTLVPIGKFTSSHLEQLIGILSTDLNIPFIGLETLEVKKINENLISKGEYTFISKHSGFDANQIHFRTKNYRQNKFIKIDVEPNSYFPTGNYEKKLEQAYLAIKKIKLN